MIKKRDERKTVYGLPHKYEIKTIISGFDMFSGIINLNKDYKGTKDQQTILRHHNSFRELKLTLLEFLNESPAIGTYIVGEEPVDINDNVKKWWHKVSWDHYVKEDALKTKELLLDLLQDPENNEQKIRDVLLSAERFVLPYLI